MLEEPNSEPNWQYFTQLLDSISAVISDMVKLPPRRERNNMVRSRIHPSGDAQFVQKLYRRNRRRAIRTILEGPTSGCELPKNRVEEYFREAWGPAYFNPSFYDRNNTAAEEVNLAPFTCLEVLKRLSKAENSAPEPDRLTYNHWRATDNDASVMTLILNTCLKYRRGPPGWKNPQQF